MAVDLNSDVGESFGPWRMGDDAAMVAVVTSANVACGFHAGDPSTARATCAAAADRGVAVGAHVGYRDLVGFGRRFLDVAPTELTDDVLYQVGALQAVAAAAGTTVRYVKPHGALYTAIARHEGQARAVVRALVELGGDLPVLALPDGVVAREAERAGVRVVAEAFADRGYAPDGTLAPRGTPGALLHDPAQVARRVVGLVTDGTVPAVDGTPVRVRAESVCVHGDTPGAVAIATAVRAALDDAGVTVASFV